jgi:hypothetical protein
MTGSFFIAEILRLREGHRQSPAAGLEPRLAPVFAVGIAKCRFENARFSPGADGLTDHGCNQNHKTGLCEALTATICSPVKM